MGKRIIAIAASDFHIHNFNAFNENDSRLKWAIKAATHIFRVCKKNKVPLLFAGDLFHTPKDVTNKVHGEIHKFFKKTFEKNSVSFIAIDGNHDMSEKNTLTHIATSHLEAFEGHNNFIRLYNSYTDLSGGFVVYGIPYYEYESHLIQKIKEANKLRKRNLTKSKNILMLHGNAPGAVNPQGHEIEESKLPLKILKDWDLVLMGHIHKPQKIAKNIFMLGSDIHQTRADEGCEMGYWEVYSDLGMKFISMNNLFPEFITLNKEKLKHYEATKNKSVPDYIITENDDDVENGDDTIENNFSAKRGRRKLAKAYCKEKGITSNKKIKALIKALEND